MGGGGGSFTLFFGLLFDIHCYHSGGMAVPIDEYSSVQKMCCQTLTDGLYTSK